jgi:hypothetical protein
MVTNVIGGEVKSVSKAQFFALFSPPMQDELEEKWTDEGAAGFVCYENLQMDSSEFGKRTAHVFGPGFAYNSVGQVVRSVPRLGGAPSRFQYPVAYCVKYDAYSNHHENHDS